MTKNRIDAVLAQCKAEGRKALIPYMTAGDGGYALTEEIALAMAGSGADMIVLGVPFSDPIAEAPAVQKASERALAAGTTLAGIFEMMGRLRERTDIPVLLMMYLNTIFRFGKERFFSRCRECGVEGVIVPDMPFEEKDEIQAEADAYGIHSISLVTAASAGRIRMIAGDAKGFLYGVTAGLEDSSAFLRQVQENASLPVIAELPASDFTHAPEQIPPCDGILLSNALVELIEQSGADSPAAAGRFVKTVRAAMNLQ